MPLSPNRRFPVSLLEYPFEDHWFPYRDGFMHYVDEGSGPTILLLHGNPTWSFLYRNVIKELQGSCRLIAPDYFGFGLSNAPSDFDFSPSSHASVVKDLIERLDLEDIILVVQDWGGPIGMSYAIQNSANVRGLVVMNSWAWEASIPQKLFSLVMGSWPLGYMLQTRLNLFARKIVPQGIFHKEKITDELQKAYTEPFPTPASRLPTWVFPRQIRLSRDWLRAIESRLHLLSDKPTQILWGAKDEPGFRPVEMRRWQSHLRSHRTEVLDDASHYVQEDRPDRVVAAILSVIQRTPR